MGRRQIKSNWSQFLAVIAIGGIAVTLFVGLLANADSFEGRVDAAFEEGNMADAWVTTSKYERGDEPAIRSALPEGAEMASRFETNGRLDGAVAFPTVVPSLPSVSAPYEVRLSEAVPSTDTDFFYVDVAIAGENGEKHAIGSSMNLSYDLSALDLTGYKSYLSSYLLNPGDDILDQTGFSLSLRVTGIMKFPENIQKAAYSPSVCLIGGETFYNAVNQKLLGHFTDEGVELIYEALGWNATPDWSRFPRANQYLIRYPSHEAGDSLDNIEAYFDAKGSESNLLSVDDRSSMPFVTVVNNDVKQARQFTFLFPFVFFFVGVLVILTTTSQIILKERTQIGTMKAIGLSKAQIYRHYLALTDSVVGIGILIGEIVGPLLIPAIMDNKYSIIYTLPVRTYVFPLLYGILTALAFLAVASLVTYLICRKEVRLNPAQSMRPAVPGVKGKSGALPPLKRPSAAFLSIKMAFRNIRFDIGKSVMVIVGVMGCTALLVCGFGIEDTVYYGIDHDMSLFNNASVMMTFSVSKKKSDILADLSTVDGVDVERCDPFSRATATVTCGDRTVDSHAIVLSFDPVEDSHFQLGPFDHSTLAISQKVADETGAKLGEAISFDYEGAAYSAPVGLIFEAFAFNGVVACHDAPFFASEPSYSGAYLECVSGFTPDEIKGTIGEEAADGGRFGYVTECSTQKDWSDKINDVMSGVLIMTNAVKGFGIALAIVVLYNLALLNFRERTRDIATLKVLGFRRREIASSLLWETMTLTFIGVALGFALGYPFLLGVMGLNKVELVSYLYVINFSSYGLAFLLTFVVDFAVNGGLSLLTGKVRMVESLKSVE
ncbi:MAG: ABC transporter permease [Bacilli bacterium]|jgi:ABC-type antimicrobial peptide transport system permease subunit|nr:ABC transporter permease [Bacilli bacterium]